MSSMDLNRIVPSRDKDGYYCPYKAELDQLLHLKMTLRSLNLNATNYGDNVARIKKAIHDLEKEILAGLDEYKRPKNENQLHG